LVSAADGKKESPATKKRFVVVFKFKRAKEIRYPADEPIFAASPPQKWSRLNCRIL